MKRIIDLNEDELIAIISYTLDQKLDEKLKQLEMKQDVSNDGDLMTQKDCAKYLKKSLKTIQNWTKSEKIPALYLDGSSSVFYSKKEIKKTMEKNRMNYQLN